MEMNIFSSNIGYHAGIFITNLKVYFAPDAAKSNITQSEIYIRELGSDGRRNKVKLTPKIS